jgi:hypothetical protein
VPFDYGEHHERVHFAAGSDRRVASLVGGLVLPSNSLWHHGGLSVAPNGDIIVAAMYHPKIPDRRVAQTFSYVASRPYSPRIYPGRLTGGILVHVFDRHGKVSHMDAAPGLHANVNGVALDARGDIYLLNASPMTVDGKPFFDPLAGTLMKFTPGEGRVLTADRSVRVPLTEKPDRPPDLRHPTAWVEGAHWMFGGIGWGGQNPGGSGCACWNCRFALDYLARSFAPETNRYSVAVLDAAGNLITRIGSYGNVDDGKPLIADGGPPNPRPIGGDEVALFRPAYVATHSDRRLFIADAGNARIVSVKLGYHAEQSVRLRDVAEVEAR